MDGGPLAITGRGFVAQVQALVQTVQPTVGADSAALVGTHRAADQQHLPGSCGGDVEQALRLGRDLVSVALLRQAVGRRAHRGNLTGAVRSGCQTVLPERGDDTQLRVDEHATAGGGSLRDVPDDDHRELEPFCLVDAHDLHGPGGDGPRLALAGLHVPQLRHVGQEARGADGLAGVGIVQQLIHVAGRPRLAGPQERCAVGCLIEECLEHVGHGDPTRHGVEAVDQVAGGRCSLSLAVQHGELILTEKRPQGRQAPGMLGLAQSVERHVGESQGGGPEEACQGQIVRGIGDGLERIE